MSARETAELLLVVGRLVQTEGRKYLTALIEIDFENVAQWARQRQILAAS